MTMQASRPPDLPLTAPLTARIASRALALRRGALIALTFALHAALIGGIALTDLLVIETMKPPRAATQIPIRFVPPGPADGGGGQARPPAPKPAVDAPPIQVPPPKPVVFPLPPPSEARQAVEPMPALDNAGPGDGIGEGPSGAGRGPGSGSGSGSGHGTGDGIGDGDGTGGTGIDRPDGPYVEGHPGITPPVLIASSRVYPRYPELARKAGVQASVILLVVIDTEGRVGAIEVMSAPDSRYGFDLATIEAVKQWRYRPALLGGRPVAVQASITFEFSLSR